MVFTDMEGYLSLVLSFIVLKAHESDCFRLTNMTAPVVQDPRSGMRLHCRFDIGGEELQAVKWYKDDNEFFRYSPAEHRIVKYEVDGVKVDIKQSECNRNSCDLLLVNLRKPESSGAYRCEISSEAPAFRLASETHNVTVAALPEEPPIIDGVKNTYTLKESMLATCTSGLGDPQPMLRFYINKQPVSNALVRDMSSDDVLNDSETGLKLKRTKIQLRMTMDRKLSNANINSPTDISCVSTMHGLGHHVASPVTTTRTFTLIDQDQKLYNQKYRWDESSADGSRISEVLMVCGCLLVLMFNYYHA